MQESLKRCVITFVLILYFSFIVMSSETLTYVSIERPSVESYDTRYFKHINMTAFRYGRRSQVYYVNMFFELPMPFDNKVQLSFFFYQWLTNRYQRSFVEMHLKWCDLIEKDLFFGAAMRQGKLAQPCPHKPGMYELYNMTILPEAIPRGFPFSKGRIICNITYLPTKELMAWGHVDMEIKTLKVKQRKPKDKL